MINKKERLQACLDHLNTVEEKYKSYYSPMAWLQEQITICDITPRQTGATSAIAELFDPAHDLYVSFNYSMVKEFNLRLKDLGKLSNSKSINYIYLQAIPSSNEKLITELAEKLEIDLPQNLKFEFPQSIRGKRVDGIVWIDIGQFGLFKYNVMVYDMIKFIYNIYPNVKFIIC